MKLEKEVVRDIWKMAAGCLLCTLVVLAGFFVFGKLDYRAALGGLVGWALAVGNFLLMALGVVWALDTGAEASAKKKMRLSYLGRTFLVIAVLAASLSVQQVHWIPVFASVFYPRVVITVWRFLQFARNRRKHLAGVVDGEEKRNGEAFEGWSRSEETTSETEETPDAFDKLMEGFFRAPVPGEDKTENEQS